MSSEWRTRSAGREYVSARAPVSCRRGRERPCSRKPYAHPGLRRRRIECQQGEPAMGIDVSRCRSGALGIELHPSPFNRLATIGDHAGHDESLGASIAATLRRHQTDSQQRETGRQECVPHRPFCRADTPVCNRNAIRVRPLINRLQPTRRRGGRQAAGTSCSRCSHLEMSRAVAKDKLAAAWMTRLERLFDRPLGVAAAGGI